MGISRAKRWVWVIEYRLKPTRKWRIFGCSYSTKKLAKVGHQMFKGHHGDSKLDRPQSRIVKYVPE